nr:6555_t:CDS:2 [Entrophospora candida]
MNVNKNYFIGVGRDKEATARVYLKEGTGQAKVRTKDGKEKDLKDYFYMEPFLCKDIYQPLKLFSKEKDYDLLIRVRGSGFHSQADAIRLGLARALLKVSPEYRTTLRKGYFKEELSKEFEDIRKNPERFGLQKPFSSIAEEVLRAYKENLIEKLTFLSYTSKEGEYSLTPTKKLLANLQVLKSKSPSKTPVALITTGSMNPIHKEHVNIFELAKKEIETQDPSKGVVAGYISPTSDFYLKKKLKEEAIDEVVENLSNFLNSKISKVLYGEIKIMYLCGDDLILRQPKREEEKELERGRREASRFKKMIESGHDIVVVGRNSNDTEWKNKCKNVLDSICGPGSE